MTTDDLSGSPSGSRSDAVTAPRPPETEPAGGPDLAPATAPRGRSVAWLAVCLLAVGAAGFVAGRAVLPPQPEPPEAAVTRTYEVGDGTVSRSISLSVVAESSAQPVAQVPTSGMVTGLHLDGVASVAAGDVLLRIDERPVLAVAGTVPYFRDLGPGDTGRDVEQTQRFLRDAGWTDVDPDGRFGPGTAVAVRQWRRELGLPAGDRLERGLLVAAGELPGNFVLASDVRVGLLLQEGDDLLLRVQDEPRFYLPLRPQQVDLVPLDTEVLIGPADVRWDARTGLTVREGEEVEIELHAPRGGPPCGEDCVSGLAPVGQTVLPAQVVVVPEASGPVVPVAAIETAADGAAFVRLATGAEVPVEVLATADGVAVVSGLDIGQTVLLRTSP